MNEHAGASCALSVLIVIVFAVLLDDRNPPPLRPAGKPEATAQIDVPPPTPSPLPAPRTAKPPAVAPVLPVPLLPSAPPPRPAPLERPTVTEIPQPEVRPVAVPSVAPIMPTPPPAKLRPRSTGARSSFVEVEAGETLADVATRVYGSAESLEAFWKANRDQLAKPDSPLIRGTLLRTP